MLQSVSCPRMELCTVHKSPLSYPERCESASAWLDIFYDPQLSYIKFLLQKCIIDAGQYGYIAIAIALVSINIEMKFFVHCLIMFKVT